MPISLGTTTITALFLGTTSISSAYLGATQVFGGSFTPLSLFSTGAQGIWLDPSDLSTMFSDRAGTTAVTTPGTVVGLRLDKSKGLALGAELVTNGDFATDSWWLKGGGCTISGGVGVATAALNGSGFYRTAFLTIGSYYEITFTVVSVSAGGFRVGFFASAYSATRTAPGTYTVRLRADGTAFVVETVGTTTGTVDNVSVKEVTGSHATAQTDAARPIYGVEPKGGRRNLLTYSEDYSNAVWSKVGVTASGQRITANAATGTAYAEIAYANAPASAVTISAVFPSTAGRNRYVWMGDRGVSPIASATFDLNSVSVVGKAAAVTALVVTLPDGSVKCSVTYTRASVGTSTPQFALAGATYTSDRPSLTWAGGEFLDAKMQFELGSTATAYQRVTTAYDVTESGVATCHYLQYDGANSSMSTSAIDFTGTDKMSVFAGVRKLSDAARGMFLETSSGAANGSFSLQAPNGSAANNYEFNSIGTSSRAAVGSGLVAPISNVLTGLADIAAPSITLRVNGSQAAQSLFSQGTGNYGNHALFIGRRGGASLPFNGRDYGLIIVGKAASAGEITDTELWLSDKTAEVDVAKSISPNIYTRSGDTILDRANFIIERRTV